MNLERSVRLLAGILILASMALGYEYSHYFYWLPAFVGLNLLQSAFTNWCPAMTILRALGVRESR